MVAEQKLNMSFGMLRSADQALEEAVKLLTSAWNSKTINMTEDQINAAEVILQNIFRSYKASQSFIKEFTKIHETRNASLVEAN